VLCPTRENNILDFILTSEEGMVEELEVQNHLGNSDHNTIVFKLVHSTVMKPNSNVKLDYNKGDYVKMNNFFSLLNWEILLNDLDVEDMWSKFHEVCMSAVDEFVPKKTFKNSKYPQWMTRGASRLCKSKSTLWKDTEIAVRIMTMLSTKEWQISVHTSIGEQR